jgi:phage terminase small subunit
MLALPNDKWRLFVINLVTGKPGQGAQVRAYVAAGCAGSRKTAIVEASKMIRDERVVAAIGEESRKWLRAGHPHAVAALHAMVRNTKHRDHARAVSMILDRTDPVVSNQMVHVHKTDNTGMALVDGSRLRRQPWGSTLHSSWGRTASRS